MPPPSTSPVRVCRLASNSIRRVEVGLHGLLPGLLAFHPQGVPGEDAMTMPARTTPMAMDHRSSTRARLAAACAWSAVVRRRSVIVVCREASVASRFASAVFSTAASCAVCGVARLAGQEGAEAVLRGDEGGHPAGQSREPGRRRPARPGGAAGWRRTCSWCSRPSPLPGTSELASAVLLKASVGEDLEVRRRCPDLPDGLQEHEVALASAGQLSDSASGRVGHPRKAPASAISGQHDAEEDDGPVRQVPLPRVPDARGRPGAHGVSYRHVAGRA